MEEYGLVLSGAKFHASHSVQCVWWFYWPGSLITAMLVLTARQTYFEPSRKDAQEVAVLRGILLVRIGWGLISQLCAEMEFVNVHDLELAVLSDQSTAEKNQSHFICIHFETYGDSINIITNLMPASFWCDGRVFEQLLHVRSFSQCSGKEMNFWFLC